MHIPIQVSQTDPRPMYLQIKEQLRHRIAVGELQPGEEIPSIRALAVSTRVSVITIKRAYLELEHEGVILTRQGRGSFVAENANLGSHLQAQELDEQLTAAVHTAALLGIKGEALVERLREIERDLQKRQP
ncbi:MAG TPA: GntR family transcriptional regulator [Steroidobacteraceae bacterium]|jgi:GntR family transcriptional regulator|nr:GntR family transcriptional regulator [Steroidobacteraceae bacterium]